MRRHTRLSVMYKMYCSFLDGKWEDHLIPNRKRRRPGSHDNKFIVPKGHKEYFQIFLLSRDKIRRCGRQRERQKNNWFNNKTTTSRFFLFFFSCFCTTTTRKCLIWRFMEDVNKQRRIFISLSELGYGPLKFRFRRVCLHLTM